MAVKCVASGSPMEVFEQTTIMDWSTGAHTVQKILLLSTARKAPMAPWGPRAFGVVLELYRVDGFSDGVVAPLAWTANLNKTVNTLGALPWRV